MYTVAPKKRLNEVKTPLPKDTCRDLQQRYFVCFLLIYYFLLSKYMFTSLYSLHGYSESGLFML